MLTATIDKGAKTNRVKRVHRAYTPRKCCGYKRGPHVAGCLQHYAGRGRGKTGRIAPSDRGRFNRAAGKTIAVCISMLESELEALDALAARLKLTRSETIRRAVGAL